MRRITFKGRRYVLVGSSLAEGGPIATEQQYRHGRCSFAHLYANGDVNRHGRVIGHRDDITDLGDCEIAIAEDAWRGVLRGLGAISAGKRWT